MSATKSTSRLRHVAVALLAVLLVMGFMTATSTAAHAQLDGVTDNLPVGGDSGGLPGLDELPTSGDIPDLGNLSPGQLPGGLPVGGGGALVEQLRNAVESLQGAGGGDGPTAGLQACVEALLGLADLGANPTELPAALQNAVQTCLEAVGLLGGDGGLVPDAGSLPVGPGNLPVGGGDLPGAGDLPGGDGGAPVSPDDLPVGGAGDVPVSPDDLPVGAQQLPGLDGLPDAGSLVPGAGDLPGGNLAEQLQSAVDSLTGVAGGGAGLQACTEALQGVTELGSGTTELPSQLQGIVEECLNAVVGLGTDPGGGQDPGSGDGTGGGDDGTGGQDDVSAGADVDAQVDEVPVGAVQTGGSGTPGGGAPAAVALTLFAGLTAAGTAMGRRRLVNAG